MSLPQLPSSPELINTLLNSYIEHCKSAKNTQDRAAPWVNIYETFYSNMSGTQKAEILKQILISTANNLTKETGYYKSRLQNKIQELVTNFENTHKEEANNLINEILNMKDSKINDTIKLTSIFFFSNIQDRINNSKVLSRNINTKIKIGIDNKKWEEIWPQLTNITNTMQRINILSISMYSNMMENETSTNNTSGLTKMLSNFTKTKISLDNATEVKLWKLLKNRCIGKQYEKHVSSYFTQCSDKVESHIYAILKAGYTNITDYLPKLVEYSNNKTLPSDIKHLVIQHLENIDLSHPINILDLNNYLSFHREQIRLWNLILDIYPEKNNQLLKLIVNSHVQNTEYPFLNSIINIIDSNVPDVVNMLGKLAKTYNKTLNQNEILIVEELLIKDITTCKKIDYNYLEKLKVLYSLAPEAFKNLIINTSVMSRIIALSYNDIIESSMPNGIVTEISRRFISTEPPLINYSQPEFELLSLLAPQKLTLLHTHIISKLDSNIENCLEYTNKLDNVFFTWMQSEILHKKPMSIKDVAILSESLGTKPAEIIKSWGFTEIHDSNMPTLLNFDILSR